LRPRVLIFEDNDTLRSSLKYILNARGYEVFTYSDWRRCPAYDPINHQCPIDHACADIIISDVNMPTKTGFELIKELQQKGCKAKHRALMSGDWTDSGLKYAQELGCHIFHKPFDIRKMLWWLDDCAKKINPERKLSDSLTKPD
jgi:DNA-binding response OmpR family regulator